MFYGLDTINIDDCKSYATKANAIKAVQQKLGTYDATGVRAFNVVFVYNSKGRVVPMICNITDGFLTAAAHSGFLAVN